MEISLKALERAGEQYLPGLIGIEVDGFEDGVMRAHVELRKAHFAPNGYVHAGAIVTLADTTCGGRTTQLWDAAVTDPEGRTMALFRATQLLLRPAR